MGEVISKSIFLKDNSLYIARDLAEYIAEEINKQCPEGYCLQQISESLSDIKKIKGRGISLFSARQIVVFYQKID